MNMYDEYIENVIQLVDDALHESRIEEAKRLLEGALMEEPGYAKLHAKLGDLYNYETENLAMAENHYHLAIRFYPKYQEVYRDLADMYLDHRKFDGLKKLMTKALDVEGIDHGLKKLMTKALDVEGIDQAFVYEKLGQAAEAQGQYKEAIEFYRKGLFASLDNTDASELKKHIKRNKYKRLKLRWRRVKMFKN